MGWTDNPAMDYERWSAEQEAELDKLPKCDVCGKPIDDEFAYVINGDTMCEDCMADNYRVSTEKLI